MELQPYDDSDGRAFGLAVQFRPTVFIGLVFWRWSFYWGKL